MFAVPIITTPNTTIRTAIALNGSCFYRPRAFPQRCKAQNIGMALKLKATWLRASKATQRIGKLSQSLLVRNTLWMLGADGGTTIILAVYFVVLARVLQPSEFGAFAGALALVSIVAPFAGWGASKVLVMAVARDPRVFAMYWGNALVSIVTTATCLLIVLKLVGRYVLPVSAASLVPSLALAELLFSAVTESCAHGFLGFERLKGTAGVRLVGSTGRMLATLLFALTVGEPRASTWVQWYLASSVVTTTIVFVATAKILGMPKPTFSLVRGNVKDGWYFSVGLAFGSIYSDIDKAMLARMSTFEATGIYSAAYKMIRLAFLPVSSLLAASYSKFFQVGESGIDCALSFSRRLLPFAACYGFLACLALEVFASVIPHILGRGYVQSVEAIRWLAPIPFFQSLHYLAGDTLTGASYQPLRSLIVGGVAVLNILLNLLLLPQYSWRGAAWSSVICDGTLVVCLWLAVAILSQRAPLFQYARAAK